MDEIIQKKDPGKTVFIFKVFFLAMIAIVIFYTLFDLIIMPLYTRQWQNIHVPEVTFSSFRAAKKILKKKGLVAVSRMEDEKYDSNYPPGYVLFQNPESNTPVKKGRHIYLSVCKGQQIIEMPVLIGMSERDTRFLLNEKKLVLGNITYKNDEFYPAGVIAEQSVMGGDNVSVGDKIDLVISLGDEPLIVTVPVLVGKSAEEAVTTLKQSGLTLGNVHYQETDKILPNTVLRQSIQAGTNVSRNDTLSIVLSTLPGKKGDTTIW